MSAKAKVDADVDVGAVEDREAREAIADADADGGVFAPCVIANHFIHLYINEAFFRRLSTELSFLFLHSIRCWP